MCTGEPMLYVEELLIYVPFYMEFFLIVFLLLAHYGKKPHFRAKIAAILSGGVLWQLPLCALIYIPTDGAAEIAFGVFKFVLCILPVYFLYFAFKVKFQRMTYLGILAMLLQRWSSVFAGVVAGFTPLEGEFLFERAVSWLSFALMLVIVWFSYIRRVNGDEDLAIDGITITLFIFLAMAFELILVVARNYLSGNIWSLILSLAELAFIVFMLYQSVRIAALNRERLERSVSDALLEKERRQYEALKQNMENMRSQMHDLKYILRAARDGATDAETEQRLEHIVNFYESAYNTGNPELDIILSDAAKMLEAKDIRFECCTENCMTGFIKSFDLYSLLGNAFDNAAEYLCGVEKEKRYVSCVIRGQGGFIYIEVSNYYSGSEAYVGMPTTKADAAAHGFGIKNMRRIAEKYGGELSVRAEGGAFYVSALLPVPGDKREQ